MVKVYEFFQRAGEQTVRRRAARRRGREAARSLVDGVDDKYSGDSVSKVGVADLRPQPESS